MALWQLRDPVEQRMQLENTVSNFKPDFVFTEGFPGVDPDVLFSVLIPRRIRHVYWAIEDPVHFELGLRRYSRHSFHVFTPAAECIPVYRQRGQSRVHLLEFACNPGFHRFLKPERDDTTIDVVLVANNYRNYPCRLHGIENVVLPVIDLGVDFRIYGNNLWVDQSMPVTVPREFWYGYLPYEQLPRVYSRSKIVLGIHSVCSSKTMMSMRTYEVLGCGAFFLTQHTAAIATRFRNGVHLVTTQDAAATRRLALKYLNNPETRAGIARQGQLKVYSEDTYAIRAQTVADCILR